MAVIIHTSANSHVDFISLQSSVSNQVTAGFVVVAVSAMECEVEVVSWQKAKRMKSSLVAGQIVGHHVGGAQILEYSVQYRGGAVLLGRAQGDSEIAPARSLRNSPQEHGARRLVLPHINGVDQCASVQHRLQRLAWRMHADGVVSVREQNHDRPGPGAAMM